MHQQLDFGSDAYLGRLRRAGTGGAQPSAAVDGAPISPRPGTPISPRTLHSNHQGPTAGSALSPRTAKQTLDTYDVVQLLEKELASERFERREEVSFITKMHEREVDVWKTRTNGATQRLEEERKIFERETGSLDSKLALAIERANWHEERARQLEEQLATQVAALDAARAAGRRAEAAADTAVQAKDAEHETERRLAQEAARAAVRRAEDEREKLAVTLKQVEHDAQLTAQDLRHAEVSAQRDCSVVEQRLRSTESTLVTLQQQEAQTVAQLQAQEVLAAQAREHADAQIAAQACDLLNLRGKHEDACRTMDKLKMQVEAARQQASEAAQTEQRTLEALGAKHAAEILARSSEHEVELRHILEQERCEAATTHDALRTKHDLLEKELAEAKLAAERGRSESERTALHLEQQLEQQSREVQHLQHALRQHEEWREGRVEADVQRELEHARILQKESEAVTAHRLEVSLLERTLHDERSRILREERESELREAQHATIVEDLQRNSAKAASEILQCQTALTVSEQKQSRSRASLELAESELLAARVQMKFEDSQWTERLEEVQAALSKSTGEAKAQTEKLASQAEREQQLVAEVERQRADMEALRRRMREELEEVDSKRLTTARANEQLQGEWEQSRHQNQQLLRTCQFQEHRISMLDSTLRSHLQILDNEVADLCSLKRVIASSDLLTGPMSPVSEVAFAP
mmetsp:Transcript_55239/g.103751  ORF Transcript_55239/g.103751 Transcript_55239/m.103751 type:complete len:701 (-) Transcript_55239:102-2204(-)